jgi:hypothetical protein
MKIIKEAYSGAQSSGKSTRIEAVKRIAVHGFPIVTLPEFATVVASMGYKLNMESGIETQEKMVELQIEAEINAEIYLRTNFPNEKYGLIICDRPVYDSLVYSELAHKDKRVTDEEMFRLTKTIWDYTNKHPYDKIWFCHPRALYDDGDGMRVLGDVGEMWQKRVHNQFKKFYKENESNLNVEYIVR